MRIDSRLACIGLACGLITLAITFWFGADALPILLQNGLVALAMLLAAVGAGLPISRALGFAACGVAVRYILGLALGLGMISLCVLSLGVVGIMQRSVWLILMGLLIAAALMQIAMELRRFLARSPEPRHGAPPATAWLLIAPAVFFAFGILAATLPPGMLWLDEGFGYDVLEYHLGAPREFYEAGAIEYLPHNIYSNFPFNVEMQYLLAMILHGDPLAAAFTAQLLHLLSAALAVVAIGIVAAQATTRAGILAATIAGTAPMLVYVSALAYVENGMLLFAATAVLAILLLRRDAPGVLRRAAAVGMLLGFAGGCKYTALPMIVAPLLLVEISRAWRRRQWSVPLCLLAGFFLTMGPWLVKNLVMTGNPVFPLARAVFPERPGVWDDAGAAQWVVGHMPIGEERTPRGRLGELWREVLWNPLYGPYPLAVGGALVASAIALQVRRKRKDGARPACASTYADRLIGV